MPRGREFKDYSLDELADELTNIASKSHSASTIDNIRYENLRPFLIGSMLSDDLRVYIGPTPIPLTDATLEQAKVAANIRLSQEQSRPYRYFVHNCTFLNILSNMFNPGSKPILLQTTVALGSGRQF